MKIGLTNLMGTITAILAGALGVLKAVGCLPGDVDFTATCSISWLPAGYLPYAVAITGAVAFASKLLRPGTWLRNLIGGTAVIVPPDLNVKGTVTPGDVAKS